MQFYSLQGYYWWSHHASISKMQPSSPFMETFMRTQQHKLPLSFLASPCQLLDEVKFVRWHPQRVFHTGGRLCEKVTDVHALARLAWCGGPVLPVSSSSCVLDDAPIQLLSAAAPLYRPVASGLRGEALSPMAMKIDIEHGRENLTSW